MKKIFAFVFMAICLISATCVILGVILAVLNGLVVIFRIEPFFPEKILVNSGYYFLGLIVVMVLSFLISMAIADSIKPTAK